MTYLKKMINLKLILKYKVINLYLNINISKIKKIY